MTDKVKFKVVSVIRIASCLKGDIGVTKEAIVFEGTLSSTCSKETEVSKGKLVKRILSIPLAKISNLIATIEVAKSIL